MKSKQIMNRALWRLAAAFGAFAGFGGIEHGYFEILQGHGPPEGIMITSIGPPCIPEEVWHACEPAMTILPSFFATGIISGTLGIVTMTWSLRFLQRNHGGLVLMLLSTGLLLFGGGIFPPVIGFIGGMVGLRINRPLPHWQVRAEAPVVRSLVALWPGLTISLFVWLFGQVLFGHFFNDLLLRTSWIIPPAILILLAVSVLTAFAHDAHTAVG